MQMSLFLQRCKEMSCISTFIFGFGELVGTNTIRGIQS